MGCRLFRKGHGRVPVKELCRRHRFSDAPKHNRRAESGGMEVAKAKGFKDAETEDAGLERLLTEAMADMSGMKDAVRKKRIRKPTAQR